MNSSSLRPTRSRNAVQAALQKAGRPLSHGELVTFLGRNACDRVTIYRALAALEGSGLLHRVQGPDGVWRFRLNETGDTKSCAGNHAHFLCEKCSRMFCLPEQPLPWVKPPKGAVINAKQFVAHGRCPACVSAGKAKGKK